MSPPRVHMTDSGDSHVDNRLLSRSSHRHTTHTHRSQSNKHAHGLTSRPRAPLTTRKLKSPPKPRTRKWPFGAAPAAPAAASEHRSTKDIEVLRGVCCVHARGSSRHPDIGLSRAALGASGEGRRDAGATHLQDADDHREEVDPPLGGDSAHPGLEPEPRRHTCSAQGHVHALHYGECETPAKGHS